FLLYRSTICLAARRVIGKRSGPALPRQQIDAERDEAGFGHPACYIANVFHQAAVLMNHQHRWLGAREAVGSSSTRTCEWPRVCKQCLNRPAFPRVGNVSPLDGGIVFADSN